MGRSKRTKKRDVGRKIAWRGVIGASQKLGQPECRLELADERSEAGLVLASGMLECNRHVQHDLPGRGPSTITRSANCTASSELCVTSTVVEV